MAREAAARADGDQRRAADRETRREPEARAHPLDPEREGEQAGHHGKRPEHERNRGGSRQLGRVHECDLVEADANQGRDPEKDQVAAAQREGSLAPVGDPAENRRCGAEAEAAVRERLEAVGEDVLRDGEVEPPERDRREQHQVC